MHSASSVRSTDVCIRDAIFLEFVKMLTASIKISVNIHEFVYTHTHILTQKRFRKFDHGKLITACKIPNECVRFVSKSFSKKQIFASLFFKSKNHFEAFAHKPFDRINANLCYVSFNSISNQSNKEVKMNFKNAPAKICNVPLQTNGLEKTNVGIFLLRNDLWPKDKCFVTHTHATMEHCVCQIMK